LSTSAVEPVADRDAACAAEAGAHRRRRIALFGATEAALALLPALARRTDLELVIVYDPSARALRRRLALIEPGAARLLQGSLCDDFEAFRQAPAAIDIAIDGCLPRPLREVLAAQAAEQGIELLDWPEASRRLGLAAAPWREPVAPDGLRGGPADPSTPWSRAPGPAVRRLTNALDAALRSRRPFVLMRCRADATNRADAADTDLVAIRDRIVESLRGRVRGDDRLETTANGSVLALWIDAGDDGTAEQRRARARDAANAIADAVRDATPRPSLAFGYALHPEDGCDRATLLRRLSSPRIRIV
jgi:hypothetical protein